MKEFIRRLVCIFCALVLVTGVASAATLYEYGDYTFTLKTDYDDRFAASSYAILEEYIGGSTAVIVPKYVYIQNKDKISEYPVGSATGYTYEAYKTTLQSIVWSDYLLSISGFQDFTALHTVVIPEGVTSIGSFKNCVSLKDIALPSTITKLTDYAFENCTSLTSFDLNCVNTMGMYAFKGCTNLTDLDLGASLKTLRGYCFDGTNISELELPASLTKIEGHAFTGSKIKSIEIPDSVTSIASNTFDGHENVLEHVKWTAGLDYIYGSTFKNFTSLKSVELPEGLLTIGRNPDQNGASGNSYSFSGCTALPSVDFPDSLTGIGHHSFYGCTSLSSVSFGSNLEFIGTYAFYDTALTRVCLPGSVTSIGTKAFPEGCVIVCVPGSVTEETLKKAGYEYKYELEEPKTVIALPANLTTIGDEAFSNTDTEYVIVPDGCKSIGSKAFADMDNLKYVKLPGSVDSIATDAFDGCNIIEVIAPAGSYAEDYFNELEIHVVNP